MLDVKSLTVDFDGKGILHGLDLQVDDGEIVAVLGPSGSGKTTLLRAIAGLVEVGSGDIRWNGKSIVDVPTHLRDFGLMFQGYALFPHLTVAENVGFGLRMSKHERVDQEVGEALHWLGLEGYEARKVDSLSGGERQRVALARTLAPKPRLVMLDEPLGALDRSLRERLVIETRAVLEQRDVTALVVTHDRDEAAQMTDRIALMREGTIVQAGRLEELLTSPADPWVERFLR